MGLYKKWKELKPSVKVGLVGSVIYTATALGIPAYAAVEESVKEEQVVQPVNVENITTLEQVDSLYKEKLTEYSSDKILNLAEIDNLREISLKTKNLLDEQKNSLMRDYGKSGGDEVDKLDAQIADYQKRLNSGSQVTVLVDTRKKLDEQVLVYYPALINKSKGNVTYEADDNIPSRIGTIMQELSKEADKILQECFDDKTLAPLAQSTYFNINDILILYHAIHGKDISFGWEKEKELKTKIEELENKKSELTAKNDNIVVVKGDLDSLDARIESNSQLNGFFKRYYKHKENVENFEAKFGNFNNMLAGGLLHEEWLDSKGIEKEGYDSNLDQTARDFMEESKVIVSGLEAQFKTDNIEVDVEGFANPASKRFPFWLGSLLFGFGIPIFRNIAVKCYIKGKGATDDEYFISGCAGAFNGLLGIGVDGLHPLVYPARMLSPLVLQPIFKIMKKDPCKAVVDELY